MSSDRISSDPARDLERHFQGDAIYERNTALNFYTRSGGAQQLGTHAVPDVGAGRFHRGLQHTESLLQGRDRVAAYGGQCDVIHVPAGGLDRSVGQLAGHRQDLEPLHTREPRSSSTVLEQDISRYAMKVGTYQEGYVGVERFADAKTRDTRSLEAPPPSNPMLEEQMYGRSYATYGLAAALADAAGQNRYQQCSVTRQY
jgi:hypothetical protein